MSTKKTLVIYPGKSVFNDAVFTLLDPETGEVLASHFCSSAGFARGDLYTNRNERKKTFQQMQQQI